MARNDIPFLWKGRHYKIIRAGISSEKPYADVEPNCPELVSILCAKLETDKGLVVYLGNGYNCFPEDRE